MPLRSCCTSFAPNSLNQSIHVHTNIQSIVVLHICNCVRVFACVCTQWTLQSKDRSCVNELMCGLIISETLADTGKNDYLNLPYNTPQIATVALCIGSVLLISYTLTDHCHTIYPRESRLCCASVWSVNIIHSNGFLSLTALLFN